MEVTVGNVTVVITDYKLLPVKEEKSPPSSPSPIPSTKDELPSLETETVANKANDLESNEEKVIAQHEVAVSL